MRVSVPDRNRHQVIEWTDAAMKFDEFTEHIIPDVVAAWRMKCFCHDAGFRKLVSFNFEDYGAGPMALLDSEIVAHHIVRERFLKGGEVTRLRDGELLQQYTCPQCGARCEEQYGEYSISMDRSWFRYLDGGPIAPEGVFLVGIRAFSRDDFLKVHDFREAASTRKFLESIGAAEPVD